MLKFLLALVLAGCSTVPETIRDHVVYGDEGKFGAAKVHTLNSSVPAVAVPKAEWDSLRIGMACMAVADLSEIQESIDSLCTKFTGACDYALQETIANTITALATHSKKAK